MALRMWEAGLVGALLVACASTPPPPRPAAAPAVVEPDEQAEPEEPAPEPSQAVVDTPERSRPPSTASYEEALSSPEPLGAVHDDRVQLTDAQLTGPMRSVVGACRLPPNAKVSVKTVVQRGRAIGVTVKVRFERPTTARRQSRAAAKAEAKAAAKIVTCVDRAVRAVTWPPSSRRDSFTTEF